MGKSYPSPAVQAFFSNDLAASDEAVLAAVQDENQRQEKQIELIASENIVSSAVMLALLQPGDTILGMSLDAGGHLTHGARPAQSGKWFNAVQYGVSKETQQIDYDAVEALAVESSRS